MADACDQHYTWVACKPGWPGAYAAHTDEKRYRSLLRNWKLRELLIGATVKRVTCNEAQALMNEYLVWCDKQPKSRRTQSGTNNA